MRLAAIGVTWSSGRRPRAAVLRKKLADAGFTGVIPVRLPQATDALARRVAGIVGFDTTGVCVLEPDVVQAMTVSGNDPVQTTVSRGIETVAGLTTWLSDIFDAAAARPDALVVVGSAVDLDSVLPKLEQALAVPVFTPAEPGLPLARGAALASVRRGRLAGDDGTAPTGWRWPAATIDAAGDIGRRSAGLRGIAGAGHRSAAVARFRAGSAPEHPSGGEHVRRLGRRAALYGRDPRAVTRRRRYWRPSCRTPRRNTPSAKPQRPHPGTPPLQGEQLAPAGSEPSPVASELPPGSPEQAPAAPVPEGDHRHRR